MLTKEQIDKQQTDTEMIKLLMASYENETGQSPIELTTTSQVEIIFKKDFEDVVKDYMDILEAKNIILKLILSDAAI